MHEKSLNLAKTRKALKLISAANFEGVEFCGFSAISSEYILLRRAIGVANFAVDSGGPGSGSAYNSLVRRNVPVSRHGNFGQLSFADGRADKLCWLVRDTHSLKRILANPSTINNPDRKQL